MTPQDKHGLEQMSKAQIIALIESAYQSIDIIERQAEGHYKRLTATQVYPASSFQSIILHAQDAKSRLTGWN